MAGNAWTVDGFRVTRYRSVALTVDCYLCLHSIIREGGESNIPLWNGLKAPLGPYEALWRSTDSAAVKQYVAFLDFK